MIYVINIYIGTYIVRYIIHKHYNAAVGLSNGKIRNQAEMAKK